MHLNHGREKVWVHSKNGALHLNLKFEKLCLLFTVYIYLLFEIVFSEQEDKCAQIKSAISNCTEK